MYTKKKIFFLNNRKLKIKEPTISEMEEIDDIFKEMQEVKEDEVSILKFKIFSFLRVGISRIEVLKQEICDILKIDILDFDYIITDILQSFQEKKDNASSSSYYFQGTLGILAKQNNLDLKTFCNTYCMSDLEELGKVSEYYMNLKNGEKEKNYKFYQKYVSPEYEKKLEEDIKRNLSEEEYERYLKEKEEEKRKKTKIN